MDEKMLEQEYRKLKRQAAPDLWNRLERKLAEHPEREAEPAEMAGAEYQAGEPARLDKAEHQAAEPARLDEIEPKAAQNISKRVDSHRRVPVWRPAFGMAAAAALVVVTVVVYRLVGSKCLAPELMMRETLAASEAAPMAPENELAEMIEETAADMIQENDGIDAGAGGSDKMEAGGAGSGAYAGAEAFSGERTGRGVLTYEELELAAYQPMAVPDRAVTVPEDSAYFSEAILGDTGLLCGGTVTEVSLEQDASGRAVKVVYEISLDQVYYSEDYTTGMETITVKSPIVETEGDKAYVLYQLQKGGTYLLPLKDQDGAWELLYPFAPQIQVTGDGAYLFHSGFASLVSSEASVVIGSQEGDSDFYYDRMLLRDDDNFLSDLISLVEREAQGRK